MRKSMKSMALTFALFCATLTSLTASAATHGIRTLTGPHIARNINSPSLSISAVTSLVRSKFLNSPQKFHGNSSNPLVRSESVLLSPSVEEPIRQMTHWLTRRIYGKNDLGWHSDEELDPWQLCLTANSMFTIKICSHWETSAPLAHLESNGKMVSRTPMPGLLLNLGKKK